MSTLIVLVNCVLTCTMAGTMIVNTRRWRREHDEQTRALDAAALIVVELLMRCRSWLDCDHCGGTLDPRALDGIAIGLDEHRQLVVSCSTCHAARCGDDDTEALRD